MLADSHGRLRLAAASSERARLLELIELQNDEGPCLDAFRTGRQVSYVETDTGGPAPWPLFASHAKAEGFSSVHALPMKLRQQVIGALNLFGQHPVQLPTEDVRVAQAFADIATIAILQERLVKEREVLASQLQTALDSRVVIEQAKGVLAERLGFDMDTAFSTLRDAARRANRRLSESPATWSTAAGAPTCCLGRRRSRPPKRPSQLRNRANRPLRARMSVAALDLGRPRQVNCRVGCWREMGSARCRAHPSPITV